MKRDAIGVKFGARRRWLALSRLALLGALLARLALLGALAFAAGPESVRVGGFVFEPPLGWQRLAPASAMRKAQFRVPGSGRGSDGGVVFYHFAPGRGGSTEANIERWYLQFSEPRDELDAELEERRSGTRRLHLFRAVGTYRGRGLDGAPLEVPNFAFLGAILEAQSGRVFVRFVAPKELAATEAEGFRRMVSEAFER